MKNYKRKLNYMILVIVIVLMTIGYSILSSNLNIVGSSQINAPTWDIHWNNVQVNSSSTATVVTAPTIDSGKTEVKFNITLVTPGDYYEFNVDAVNGGTIDGMIDVVSKKVFQSDGTTETTLPDYLEYRVTYSDDLGIYPKHKLASGQTETYKVGIYYKKNIEASQIPSSPVTLVYKFSVDYVQSDSTALESRVRYGIVPTTDTTVNYTNDFSRVQNKKLYLVVGQSATGNEYTKIVFKNFQDNNSYTIIGGDEGENYNRNYNTIRHLCTGNSTYENDTSLYCDTYNGYITINKSGAIVIYDSTSRCDVEANKSISCSGYDDDWG